MNWPVTLGLTDSLAIPALPWKSASPLNTAVSAWLPGGRLLVVRLAWLPAPTGAVPSGVPSLKKVTVPPAAPAAWTVAVSVTGWLNCDCPRLTARVVVVLPGCTLIVLLTDTVGALPPAPGPPPKSAMSTLIGKAPAWAYVLTPETWKPPWAFLVMVPLVRWPSPQL